MLSFRLTKNPKYLIYNQKYQVSLKRTLSALRADHPCRGTPCGAGKPCNPFKGRVTIAPNPPRVGA